MKFKDKDGTVLEDLKRAHLEFCAGRHCKDCVLNQDPTNDCVDLRLNNPAEAARLMGYEVVEDEVVEWMCCDCVKSGPCCDWSENEDCPNRKTDGSCWRPYTESEEESEEERGENLFTFGKGFRDLAKEISDTVKGVEIDQVKPIEIERVKEANMDKQKPVAENTAMKEAQTLETQGFSVAKKQKPRICEVLGVEVGQTFTAKTPFGNFNRCVISEDGMVLNTGTNILCYIINHPESITRPPRFTEEEVADARAIMRLCPDATHIYKSDIAVRTEVSKHAEGIVLLCRINTHLLFPSVSPGQSIELAEIIGDAP